MNAKKWSLLVAMIGVLLVTAFAKDGNEIREKNDDRIKERRAYFKENIKPKIDDQRNKLEPSLSSEDQKEIARLREEIMRQRLIQNEFMSEIRASRIKGEEVDDDRLTEIRAQRIVIENLHDEAKIIANKYRPEIDELLAELKENRKEWHEEMRPKKGELDDMNRSGRRKGPRGRESWGNHRMGRGPGHGSPQGFGLVTFLLWDVNRG